MPDLTVAICTYGRAKKLRRALEALATQSILDSLHVVVVDDGSSDDTAVVASSFEFVHLIRHPVNRGIAAARNTAVQNARTVWLLFTDDDCRPDPLWAEQMLAATKEWPDAFAIGGRVSASKSTGVVNAYLRANSPLSPLEMTLAEGGGVVHRLREYLKRSASTDSVGTARQVLSVASACVAIRCEAVAQMGGWDDRFVFGGEEEEQFRRATEMGLKVMFEPSVVVEHDFDNTVGDLARRAFGYGRGNARMQLKHGGLPTIYPAPVLTVMAVVAAPFSPAAPIAAVLLPLGVFSVWPRSAYRSRDVRPLLFPYLQVLQEAASNLGWVSAWLLERRRFHEGCHDNGQVTT